MNTLFFKNFCCDDDTDSFGGRSIPEGHGAAYAPGPRARCINKENARRIEGAYYLRNCCKLFKESFKAGEEDKTALSSKAMHNDIPYNCVKHISRGVGNARH